MRPFGRLALASLVVVGFALPAVKALMPAMALPHDPRTTAKKLSQGLEVDGAGKFALDYKALHFNEEVYKRAMSNQRMVDYFNTQMWGKLGKAKLGFDLTADDVKLAAGDYEFGINMTPAEEFSIVFWQGAEKKTLKLAVERDQKPVPYLTVALMATDDVDTFVLEARCGPYRGTVDVKVPYLSEDHEHPAGGGAAPVKKQ